MFQSKRLRNFSNIKHYFFSRKGGYSKGIYKGLNCGRGSKDKKNIVIKNLSLVSKKLRVERDKLILMHQTHSSKVTEITKKNLKNRIFSDAMITRLNGIVLGVVTADCVPILIYGDSKNVIGCIHAGWKGAFSDIIKKTINKIKKINGNSKIFATVGPCISKENYEVDKNFYRLFLRKSKKNKKYFTHKSKEKKSFNLRKYVSDKLLDHGVLVDHINIDTYNEKNNFFSYRRSLKLKHKDYGRCISVIKLT